MRREIGFAILSVLISACATKPPREGQLRTPPADRLMKFQSPSDGDSAIVVTRDVGSVGSACYHAVFIDGMEVAKLATGERAVFHVPSGEHILGAWTTGSGLCGYREGTDRREQSTMLKTGETRKFRVIIDPYGGGVSIAPTTL